MIISSNQHGYPEGHLNIHPHAEHHAALRSLLGHVPHGSANAGQEDGLAVSLRTDIECGAKEVPQVPERPHCVGRQWPKPHLTNLPGPQRA